MTQTIEAKLATLGLRIPEAPQPVANYVATALAGDLLFIAGQISRNSEGRVLAGILGDTASVADGQEAAHWCALNILAQIKAALGSLERISRIVRLTGFVAATPTFTDHPKVLDGASDLLVAILGDAGRHTRAAVGVASLPLGASVEIDAIVKVR